jgi:putative oxidoreductase
LDKNSAYVEQLTVADTNKPRQTIPTRYFISQTDNHLGEPMHYFETACLLLGRILLGLYFIIPGISKINNFAGTSAYMEQHHVPAISLLLPLTIALQLSCGLALIVGFKGKFAAITLAGLTLIISIYMHDFWQYTEGVERAHEMQNFIKNMAILAGLLMIAAQGTGRLSINNR